MRSHRRWVSQREDAAALIQEEGDRDAVPQRLQYLQHPDAPEERESVDCAALNRAEDRKAADQRKQRALVVLKTV